MDEWMDIGSQYSVGENILYNEEEKCMLIFAGLSIQQQAGKFAVILKRSYSSNPLVLTVDTPTHHR